MASTNIALSTLWDAAKFKPNDSQAEAIQHVSGPLYLTAGPGSGKTRVLLWRTLNLIVFHDVKPDEIYLSTFTEKAALQLREGLRALLGLVTTKTNRHFDLSRMYVGTVHSLCQQILIDRRFTPDRYRPTAPILMDELAQYLYVYKRGQWADLFERAGLDGNGNQIVNQIFGSPSNSRHQAVVNAIAFFNRLSEECIDPAEARARLKRDGAMRPLVDLYAAYLDMLSEERVPRTDFSLLQQYALRTLQNFKDSGRVFKYVTIDEYQDTNTVQERLFFALAKGYQNLCVVGDDDQALYRFRGATVENFVEFPARCRQHLKVEPKTIPLAVNYRSRSPIVGFYQNFINGHDWQKPGRTKAQFRVPKQIEAFRGDSRPAVIASACGRPDEVCDEIAQLVRNIVDSKKVEDPNQIAFLYPSLKSVQVGRMIEALKAVGLEAYAPRAGRFLEVDEAVDVFGLFFQVFGRPATSEHFYGRDLEEFHQWLDSCEQRGQALLQKHARLARYVEAKRAEIAATVTDYQLLTQVAKQQHWDLAAPYHPDTMQAGLANVEGLSARARKTLKSGYVDRFVRARLAGNNPFPLSYMITRATSLDWNVLDLFYRLCGFKHFQQMFDLAESGADEGPICNLSLISQYLAVFMDEYMPLLTGEFLSGEQFLRVFVSSYLYALYRRGESEYEDAEDPFPRGRIPFLTIHQAKGLEFPIVVLGNPGKIDRGPQLVEKMVQPLLDRQGEPLDRMAGFDIMRMFYVALSRAQNLLVIAHMHGQGVTITEPIKTMLNEQTMPRIANFDLRTLPKAELKADDLPKTYSYTGDYLQYKRCPRQYMVFRKYGFVPARSQTMFFGNLVHQTIEDLHQHLIAERKHAEAEAAQAA